MLQTPSLSSSVPVRQHLPEQVDRISDVYMSDMLRGRMYYMHAAGNMLIEHGTEGESWEGEEGEGGGVRTCTRTEALCTAPR